MASSKDLMRQIIEAKDDDQDEDQDDDNMSTSSASSSSSSSSTTSSSSSSESGSENGEDFNQTGMEVKAEADSQQEDDLLAADVLRAAASASGGTPKMRIKLSLRVGAAAAAAASASTVPSLPAEEVHPVTASDTAHNKPRALPSAKEQPRPTIVDNDEDDEIETDAVEASVVQLSGVDDEDEDGEEDAAVASIIEPLESQSTTPSSSMSAPTHLSAGSSVVPPTSKPLTTKVAKAKDAPKRPAPTTSTTTSGNSTRLLYHSRPVRLPPISSPGLLVLPGSAGVPMSLPPAPLPQNEPSKESNVSLVKPSVVFDHAMATAGYTTDGRTSNPHRGSSVTRVVGDMFDSDIHMTLHFPQLVPPYMCDNPKKKRKQKEESKDAGEAQAKPTIDHDDDHANETLSDVLIEALSKVLEKSKGVDDSAFQTELEKKRKHGSLSFIDMVPVSLTVQYPDAYLAKRSKYIRKVEARERAIVASQKAADAATDANEIYQIAKDKWMASVTEAKNNSVGGSKGESPPMPVPPPIPAPVHVPPIPIPPSPPQLSELKKFAQDNVTMAAASDGAGDSMTQEDEKIDTGHPIYIPKGKEHFVSHLDPKCFHITQGRYFGLKTNHIADPQFVGANAPGIAGLNISGGTGLATAYVGSGSGGGGAHSSSYYSGLGNFGSSSGGGTNSGNAFTPHNNVTSKDSPSLSKKSSSLAGSSSGYNTSSGSPKKSSSGGGLKRIMEGGGSGAEEMRTCIMRSAVYASRTGAHGGSFVGSNGETYRDVSKAFAMHAGLRPCIRCKSNKQGAYHCRLRRRHQDLDYDGSDSPAILAPLFEEPLENLIGRQSVVQ